ncbi:MAG TPA: HAMP domain-containing sensor histidine kinase [Candidatus Binataceae bacterium]|nr:HAMP domain-containing sensor histidine kinase [Candidatus Binataceae bacterium]
MSLRLRLTLYWAIVTAAILLGAGSLILGYFSREMWGTLDRALLEEADTAAHALSQASPREAQAILNGLSVETDLGPGRRVRLSAPRRVWFDRGAAATRPPAGWPLVPTGVIASGVDGRSRFAVVPLQFQAQPAWLQDGIDAAPVAATVARLRRTLLLVLPLILGLCVAGGYWLSARALAPIRGLAAALVRIGPNDLRERLPQPATKDELRRLVDSINQLLTRLERASAAQRRFISEAAHELRTPLTVARSGLEVSLRRPRSVQESRLAMEEALAEVEKLCATAEDLLALARLDAAYTATSDILDMAALVVAVAYRAQPLAAARRQRISVCTDGELPVRGSRRDLERVMLNLLDNAIKFTPERGAIELVTSREGQFARLAVCDNGPGLMTGEAERIFDPFFTSPNTKAAGSGLGLALCREIVSLHHGTVVARQRAEGGCEVEVRLPLSGSNINIC